MRYQLIKGIILFFLTLGLITMIQPRLMQNLHEPPPVMSVQGQPVNAAILNDLFFLAATVGENDPPNQSWLKSWSSQSESANEDPNNPGTPDWIKPTIFDPPPADDFLPPPEPEPENPQAAIAKPKDPGLGNQNSSTGNPNYNVVDLLWILLCSGLVFIMQAGFMCLESGLTRSKNSINVAIKNFIDFGISVALFWAFGFALMFGISYQGLIGQNTPQFGLKK